MILLTRGGFTDDWESRMHRIYINVEQLVNSDRRWYGVSIDLSRKSDVQVITVIGRLADRVQSCSAELLILECW